METPKSSGSAGGGPRRLALSASHYFSPRGPISSPLATSSPMFPVLASADRPQCRPPPKPKQAPYSQQQAISNIMNISAPADVQKYEQQQRQVQRNGSRTNTIRSADLSSLFTTPDVVEAAYDIQQKLLQATQSQKELIDQAAAAIAYCRKKYSYNGTLQELSAQRLLLVSKERLTLYNRQMDQLRDQRFVSIRRPHLDDIPESVDFESLDGEDMAVASVVGLTSISEQHMLFTLFIDKFLLQLNPSFSLKKLDKEASYAFLVLCRYGDTIHATQVANVLDIGELRNKTVKFKELVIFNELPPDFCVLVEVFAMKTGKRWDHKWQSVWDFAARTLRSLKRTFTSSSSSGTTSIDSSKAKGGTQPRTSFSESSVLTQQQTPICSEFRRCGYLHLNRDSLSLGKEKFYLSDADYPLEGSIEVYARFAATNTPMEPPRPDSADVDIRIGGGNSAVVGTSGL